MITIAFVSYMDVNVPIIDKESQHIRWTEVDGAPNQALNEGKRLE
jgi:hypothetical protein